MKKKVSCLFHIGMACLILAVCAAVAGRGKTVHAEDDMPFDGFYEYDMRTGRESEYDISVPDQGDDDLVLKGYEGSSPSGNDEISTVSIKQYAAGKKTGWINKGKYTYYRTKKGTLLRDQIKKIGKNTYLFDKKGRVVKGVEKIGPYTFYYSKSDGRYLYSYVDLRVKKYEKNFAVAKKGKNQYMISSNVKVTDSRGKTVSFSRLKKGQKIRVYFQGDILETSPAQFQKVLKVKML